MGNMHVTQTGQFWTTTNSVENSLSYEADTFSTNHQITKFYETWRLLINFHIILLHRLGNASDFLASCPAVKSLYACLCFLRVPHAAWFVQPNNVWQVQIIKLYTSQFTPASRHFLYLRFKNFSQHCVTEHPRHTFFPFSEGPSSTLTQNNSHNNTRSSTFFVANGNTWFLTNKQYIIPRIQSAPNIYANTTLIFRNNFKTPAFSEH